MPLLVADSVAADDVLAIAFLAIVVFAAAALANPIITGAVAVVSDGLLLPRGAGTNFEAAHGKRHHSSSALRDGSRPAAHRRDRHPQTDADHSERLENLVSRDVELTEREGELQHLYDVSRTIGTGTDLSDVLPEIVGRVVGAIQARTGVVMIYRSDEEALEVLSPIWVAGHTLRAEGYMLPLVDGGINQRVFTSGEPRSSRNLGQRRTAPSSLSDLDASQILSVPFASSPASSAS